MPARPIEIEHLTKYYGAARGVEDVSLAVEEGDVFGFIGPNGAGKTTTIRCLLDMIFPTKGAARIFGLDTRRDSKKIKRLVGYLSSDDFYHKNMTARELLEYSAALHGLDRTATVFFSSHILSEVQKICSRVAIISDGSIVRIEDIRTLQKEHLKKVTMTLRPNLALDGIDLAGVSGLKREGKTVRFLYAGAADELLGHLVAKGIHRGLEDFLVEPSTLEEIFIDYYGRGSGEDER